MKWTHRNKTVYVMIHEPGAYTRALLWRMRHRIQNRWWDFRAFLAGYCNDIPEGGYCFWRCGKARKHYGPHRMNNYVWASTEIPDYHPIDMAVCQPWGRKPTPRLRFRK